MNHAKTLFSEWIVACAWILLVPVAVQAAFVPPTSATVHMYRLNPDGSLPPSNQRVSCSPGDQHWGCTAITNDPQYVYPFSSNPVTVDIGGNNPGDPQHGIDYNRYLRDVVPEEVAIRVSSRGNKPLSTVKAQAIAARTYVYFRHSLTINNSTQYQVFVPYYYDTLTSAQQQRVDEAVSDVWYMTLPNSTDPIDALYGADNGATTSQGSTSYLKSVPDPISAAYGSPNGTLNGGMSSRGASRWGFGHTSSRGPDYETSPNYPHDSNGDGNFWSVRYNSAKQILTHYYTGIHIRDTNGTILTPNWRWNPLSVVWTGNCPPIMQAGDTCTAFFRIQNSGVTTWPGSNQVHLSHHGWERSGVQAQAGSMAQGPAQSVQPGDDVLQTVSFTAPQPSQPGTAYRLRFDLYLDGYGWVSELEPGRPWPTYGISVCVGGPCKIFIPLVRK